MAQERMEIEISAENRTQGAFRQITRDLQNLTQAVTPLQRGLGAVAGGVGGLAAALGVGALYQQFRAAHDELRGIEQTAPRIDMPVDEFQALRGAVKLAGLDQQTFNQGVEQLARNINDAGRSENALSRLFADNNIALKDREGRLIGINRALEVAADLIMRARTEQDKIAIVERMGISRDLIPFLEQGAIGLRVMAQRARELGMGLDTAILNKTRELDREWGEFWATWESRGKRAILGVAGAISDFMQAARKAGEQVDLDT